MDSNCSLFTKCIHFPNRRVRNQIQNFASIKWGEFTFCKSNNLSEMQKNEPTVALLVEPCISNSYPPIWVTCCHLDTFCNSGETARGAAPARSAQLRRHSSCRRRLRETHQSEWLTVWQTVGTTVPVLRHYSGGFAQNGLTAGTRAKACHHQSFRVAPGAKLLGRSLPRSGSLRVEAVSIFCGTSSPILFILSA